MNHLEQIRLYSISDRHEPLFICGDALEILRKTPAETFDCCMTSPPYWRKREYENQGIGLENTYEEYIHALLCVFSEVFRTLKQTGSFWLNMGDTYDKKNLVGIPWRIAIALMDEQGWILRNDVIWNKLKGPDNSKDKLRNTHEYLFHFVKKPKGFYYDADTIRSKPRSSQVRNGSVVSATGVTGVRYKRQIQLSTSLTEEEKTSAFEALDMTLGKVKRGEISDFRMVIRKQQRTTHSDSDRLSGRAKELQQKGYYILRYHPNGSKPGDVWDIIPEDTHGRYDHYAAYPEDLCNIPLLSTCPPGGIVLDPFCGTGTTNIVSFRLERKSVGIDISSEYIRYASSRCEEYT